MSKKVSKCRIRKDGNSWCCVGPKFKNLQESASGFGDTPEEAYTDYQADVTAMKAAKKLAKAVKNGTEKVKPLSDLKGKLKAKKKEIGKVMASRLDSITEHAKVCFIGGQTPSQVLKAALAFNLTMELPLGNNAVIALVAEVGDLKSWIGEVGSTAKKKKKKKEKSLVSKILKAGGRNAYLNKVVRKAFKNGTNRAGVISIALIKNMKFNPPLQDSEVTNIVRIEWERLNPPSK